MRKTILTLLLAGIVAISQTTAMAAGDCSNLRTDIDTFASKLKYAQKADDFRDAREAMNPVKYAIDTTAEDARACPCEDAAKLFDSASVSIRKARDSDSISIYNKQTANGVKAFSAGVENLNACPQSQPHPPASADPAANPPAEQ